MNDHLPLPTGLPPLPTDTAEPDRKSYAPVSMIGVDRLSEANLRKCAREMGVDFDELVEGASRHFTSDVIVRRTSLTEAEVRRIVDDEIRLGM